MFAVHRQIVDEFLSLWKDVYDVDHRSRGEAGSFDPIEQELAVIVNRPIYEI
jgi:hypothetical protein